MKIIIAGDGKVGANLTRKLSAEGYDITLIDTNGEVLDASLERYDIMAVNGNCALMSVLSEAGVDRADVLIASTSADEINLLCCMTAHKMNPALLLQESEILNTVNKYIPCAMPLAYL